MGRGKTRSSRVLPKPIVGSAPKMMGFGKARKERTRFPSTILRSLLSSALGLPIAIARRRDPGVHLALDLVVDPREPLFGAVGAVACGGERLFEACDIVLRVGDETSVALFQVCFGCPRTLGDFARDVLIHFAPYLLHLGVCLGPDLLGLLPR